MTDERMNDGKSITIFVQDLKGVVGRTGTFTEIKDGFLYFVNERSEREGIPLSRVVRYVFAPAKAGVV